MQKRVFAVLLKSIQANVKVESVWVEVVRTVEN